MATTRTFEVCIGMNSVGMDMRHVPMTRTLDFNTVKALTDDQLTNALFYAGFGKYADDYAVTILRREQMGRWVADDDQASIERMLQDITFEAVSNLFENADQHTAGLTHTISAYDSDGQGIEVSVNLGHVGNVAD